ncbi:hypothetical protein S83_014925, partial [Arachis hypogaea]
ITDGVCSAVGQLWEAHPDLGKTNTAGMYGMRDLDAKPILFCHSHSVSASQLARGLVL